MVSNNMSTPGNRIHLTVFSSINMIVSIMIMWYIYKICKSPGWLVTGRMGDSRRLVTSSTRLCCPTRCQTHGTFRRIFILFVPRPYTHTVPDNNHYQVLLNYYYCLIIEILFSERTQKYWQTSTDYINNTPYENKR